MQTLHLLGVILYEIMVVGAILHVLMDNRQPSKTMAWVMVIYFVPIAGVVLYLFLGVNTRKERLVSQRSIDQLTKRSMLEFVEQHDLHVPDEHRQVVQLFAQQNMVLPFAHNQTEIFTDGYSFFTDLLRTVHQAQHHIHLDLYIFSDDALGRLVADALIAKAREGVEVRLIYDDVGCWHVSHSFFERMREAGIEVNPFLPVRFPLFTRKANYRNHKKLIVIDGRVGYIGGMNIALRYVKGDGQHPWRDTMVKVTGGAVYGLQRTFLVDWYFVDRTLISNTSYYPPLSPTIVNECVAQIVTASPATAVPEIMQGFLRIILSARHYLYIETPYFLPPEPIVLALKTAIMGGVDVRIIVPRKADSHWVQWAGRSYLREMVEMGAKVFLYEGGFIHSKLLLTDDSLCSCGSTNVDFRSFEDNFEANVFFYDRPTTLRFKSIFLRDEAQSSPLNLTSHPFHVRLWESITRLLSPLM